MKKGGKLLLIALMLFSIAVVMTNCGGGGSTPTYTVGGTLSGLASGESVVLQNNGADDLTITADGSFTFATAIAGGAAYAVTVQTQPAGQTCTVSNSTGTVSGANVANVTVTCSVNTYTIGGTVSGLSGTVVLQNNGGDDLTVTQDGSFTFSAALADASAYNVTVKTQPSGQTCTVSNGSGTISGANITNVTINSYNSGSLDISFDSNGIVVNDGAAGGHGFDKGNSITTDSNGKIIVTGYSNNGTNYDMIIWRYNHDGSLDTNFGNGGIVVHNNAAGGNGNDAGNSITTDANGKILVTGYSRNSSSDDDMVIWRYNGDGTLDTSFNPGGVIPGIVVNDGAAGGNGDDTGNSITTDANGKILVTGYSRNSSSDDDMVIWRYNGNGTLDTTFDTDGIVVHDNAAGGNGFDTGFSITTDSNGKILVAGWSYNTSDPDMVIWRYNGNGTLDTTFDTDGIVVHNNAAGGNGNDGGYSITTNANGKILVTGYSYNGINNDMVIWRYNGNGTLDTSFNPGGVIPGIVVNDGAAGGNGHDEGYSITTDANGKILVAGYSYNTSSDSDMVIWRYNSDGTLDTTFDTDGIVVHNNAAGGNGRDKGKSITTNANGKILVTGYSTNISGNYDMVIWRYMP